MLGTRCGMFRAKEMTEIVKRHAELFRRLLELPAPQDILEQVKDAALHVNIAYLVGEDRECFLEHRLLPPIQDVTDRIVHFDHPLRPLALEFPSLPGSDGDEFVPDVGATEAQ